MKVLPSGYRCATGFLRLLVFSTTLIFCVRGFSNGVRQLLQGLLQPKAASRPTAAALSSGIYLNAIAQASGGSANGADASVDLDAIFPSVPNDGPR